MSMEIPFVNLQFLYPEFAEYTPRELLRLDVGKGNKEYDVYLVYIYISIYIVRKKSLCHAETTGLGLRMIDPIRGETRPS
jgi:hypothetical protein